MLDSPFIVPVVAIIGGLTIAALGIWTKHRERMRLAQQGDASWQAELDALKQRVAALETLATDTREQLKREIDSL